MAKELTVFERMAEMALPADERNAIVSFDELVNADTVAEIPNPYRVIANKDELIAEPIYIKEVVFKAADSSDYDGAYCILYCVTPNFGMVIVTDGGTGIYTTIAKLVEKRLDDGIAEATQGFYFPNGLRKSEYKTLDGKPLAKGDDRKPNGSGTTHYFA